MSDDPNACGNTVPGYPDWVCTEPAGHRGAHANYYNEWYDPDPWVKLDEARAELAQCKARSAKWAALLDEIQQVAEEFCPLAVPHNDLPTIMRGIALQRDGQHELKDHLADTAARLTAELAQYKALLQRLIALAETEERLSDSPSPDSIHEILMFLRSAASLKRGIADVEAGRVKRLDWLSGEDQK
jgi:hypothetical protein